MRPRVFPTTTNGTSSLATRVVLVLTNFLGLCLCMWVVALLRGPWHSPAILLNTLAAVAFVLSLCAAARRGVPRRLLALAGTANLFVLFGVFALAAWELAGDTPWQSATGFAAMAGAIPVINAAWWLLSRQQHSHLIP